MALLYFFAEMPFLAKLINVLSNLMALVSVNEQAQKMVKRGL